MSKLALTPIGYLHCEEKYPYDAPHQPLQTTLPNRAIIKLLPQHNFEQALHDLEGFSHIWLIFQFHQNNDWKPKVLPPRGTRKIGMFATRSPHRPNPIGMTAVKLCAIQGLSLTIEGHDLLDGTPILDIKPYLKYADAIPEAVSGWIDELPPAFSIDFSENFKQQYEIFLQCGGTENLKNFLLEHLANNPTNPTRKRIEQHDDLEFTISYRTWRIRFSCSREDHCVNVLNLASGYTQKELFKTEDIYNDKEIHRKFILLTQKMS